MNIGLYCNWKVKPHKNGGFYIPSVHAKYILAFKKIYKKIFLLSNVGSDEINDSDVLIVDDDIHLIELPGFKNYLSALRFSKQIINGINELTEQCKYIYVRTPEPLCWFFMFAKNKDKIIINHHFTSNPLDVLLKQKSFFSLKKYIKYIAFLPEYYLSIISACVNNATCNGPSVLKNIPFFLRKRIRILIENTLTKEELVEKEYCERTHAGCYNFICVSRLQEGKGLQELISAFSAFLNKHIDIDAHLTIIGDGPLKKCLEVQVATLSVSNRITIQGYVQNGEPLNEFYRNAHFLINPSLSETGPRVILEAMSEGCVCLSTDVGYVRYILSQEPVFDSLIIRSDFERQFCLIAKELCVNKELYTELSMKSFFYCTKIFIGLIC
ncbi:glycosyltransferase [Escherichia coli]|nr:glycosyltransferase [Escherichia coli]